MSRSGEATIDALERKAAARVGQAADARTASAAQLVTWMRDTIPLDGSDQAKDRAEFASKHLPMSWRPQRFHEEQARAFHCTARNRAIEAGRRSGKSEGRKREIVIAALDPDWPLPDRYLVVGAPTQHQSMRLYWRSLMKLIPRHLVVAIRKTDYEIELANGAVIRVYGMDKPERGEGDPIDHLWLDEYADMRLGRAVIDDHLGPSLDTPDRPEGRLTAYGTPDMRSGEHFIALWDQWRDFHDEGDPDYATFRWSARGIVSDSAWDKAKRTRDPASFAVEYEARRVSTGNLCYYTFRRESHVHRLRFDSARDAIVTFDWNWDPATALVCQEQPRDIYGPGELPDSVGETFTAVVGEVSIRRSNTQQAARAVAAKLTQLGHAGKVLVYGDATGGGHRSSQTSGTDIDLVRKELGPLLGDRLSMRFARSNPAVRARINAMNARLCAADEKVRMLVDPSCRELIKDFEQVQWKQGASYEIEKRTDDTGKLRSHLSDGIGYWAHEVYPVAGRTTRTCAL